eukprot:5046558-Prymnesium_polylepis.1
MAYDAPGGGVGRYARPAVPRGRAGVEISSFTVKKFTAPLLEVDLRAHAKAREKSSQLYLVMIV